MPAMRQSLQAASLLPDDIRTAIGRRVPEIGGVGLIVLAGLLTTALASWSLQDPSLSHATSAHVRNLLGVPGAIVADLLMQLFGIGAVALVLPIGMRGWRLITHRPLERERLRLIGWSVGALATATFASCLPVSAAWPLPTGLGGVIGDLLLRLPAALLGSPLAGSARFIVAIVFGVGAVVALAFANGLDWRGS